VRLWKPPGLKEKYLPHSNKGAVGPQQKPLLPVYGNLRVHCFARNYLKQGFAPADEVLLFRQKDPKPFSPVRGPPGPSASAPNKMARELAPLKQPSPRSRFGAAASPHPTREKHSKNQTSFPTGGPGS